MKHNTYRLSYHDSRVRLDEKHFQKDLDADLKKVDHVFLNIFAHDNKHFLLICTHLKKNQKCNFNGGENRMIYSRS